MKLKLVFCKNKGCTSFFYVDLKNKQECCSQMCEAKVYPHRKITHTALTKRMTRKENKAKKDFYYFNGADIERGF